MVTWRPEHDRARDIVVSAQQLQFHGREWGAADAPTVLLLHGLSDHSWEWDHLANALADRFHVIALDQRGHGSSEWATDYAPRTMAADLLAVVGTLGLDRVSIVAHSMGAINSYLAVAERPALADRLVIIDVGPASHQMIKEFIPAALQAWEQATFTTPDDALAEWLEINPRAHEPEMRQYVMPNLVRRDDGLWRWRFDAAGLRQWCQQVPSEATQWDALRKIPCPTLVIRAADSEILHAPGAVRMAQELPHGQLVEIPDAGHDIHIDQPEALIATVQRFLTADPL